VASVRAPSDSRPGEKFLGETTFDPGPIGKPMTASVKVAD